MQLFLEIDDETQTADHNKTLNNFTDKELISIVNDDTMMKFLYDKDICSTVLSNEKLDTFQ